MNAVPFEDAARQDAGWLSEKRIFLKSAEGTRFVRLRPRDQILAWLGGTALVSWTVIATALVAVQFVNGESSRAQAAQDRDVYEERVQALAGERDRRHREALEAQDRFAALLEDISMLQARIFEAEITAAEKISETDSLRGQLTRAQAALDAASRQIAALSEGDSAVLAAAEGPNSTVSLMTAALADMSEERETLAAELDAARQEVADLEFAKRLESERNDRIFTKLEEAVTVSLAPMDKLFSSVGMNTDQLLDTMRRRYDGQGGPLMPIAVSTKGSADPETQRANNILTHMQELNLYRMAVDSLPMALPVPGNVRRTSGFGYRRDPIRGGTRLHSGVDWAGPYGTPIKATADGVVVFAGWQSGYGRMIKIKHEFGIETRYAHLASISVKVGQKVSRGDKIGGMGNSGRSTGTHLHYEVRLGGKATNPMTYITAARDVF